jgi:hypothetical protein
VTTSSTDETSDEQQDDTSVESDPVERSDRASTTSVGPDTELDRTAGNGARTATSEFNDMMSFKPNDGRSVTRTTFAVPSTNDVDIDTGDVDRWRRLQKLNDGLRDTSRSRRNRWADRKRWIRLMATRLDLPPWLTDRIHTVAQKMRYQPYAGAGVETEGAILAIATLLHDRHMELSDTDEWLLNRDGMDDLLDGLGLETTDLWSTIRLAKKHCYLFNDDVEPRTEHPDPSVRPTVDQDDARTRTSARTHTVENDTADSVGDNSVDWSRLAADTDKVWYDHDPYDDATGSGDQAEVRTDDGDNHR